MDYKIKHNPRRNRFEITHEGMTGYVEYNPFDGGIDIFQTLVPPSLRGKGVGQALMKAVLEFARKNNLRVIPSCSFAEVYMQRHPNEMELMYH